MEYGSFGKLTTGSRTNLKVGSFILTFDGREETMARIIKFGVIGSHLPGHETLSDQDTLALTGYVRLGGSEGWFFHALLQNSLSPMKYWPVMTLTFDHV